MSDQGEVSSPEVYSHGYEEWTREWMAQRSASDAADFLIPHLTAGMRMLDCGCGPGSITLGLASIVAPGDVVGVDIEPRQVQAARVLAAERGAGNVTFQEASIYALPFPDASFDAVLAHTVVEHLGDPLSAFREVRRVLRPGGVFGVRDPDYSTARMSPLTEVNRERMDLIGRVQAVCGGSPYYAPTQRQLLLDAGFARAIAGGTVTSCGTPQETEGLAYIVEGFVREPAFAQGAARCGYDAAALDLMLTDIRQWSREPGSFWVLTLCHAVGWAPEQG